MRKRAAARGCLAIRARVKHCVATTNEAVDEPVLDALGQMDHVGKLGRAKTIRVEKKKVDVTTHHSNVLDCCTRCWDVESLRATVAADETVASADMFSKGRKLSPAAAAGLIMRCTICTLPYCRQPQTR